MDASENFHGKPGNNGEVEPAKPAMVGAFPIYTSYIDAVSGERVTCDLGGVVAAAQFDPLG